MSEVLIPKVISSNSPKVFSASPKKIVVSLVFESIYMAEKTALVLKLVADEKKKEGVYLNSSLLLSDLSNEIKRTIAFQRNAKRRERASKKKSSSMGAN